MNRNCGTAVRFAALFSYKPITAFSLFLFYTACRFLLVSTNDCSFNDPQSSQYARS
jgi:hypothetical protein